MKAHTIKTLRERCAEVGDCLEWPGKSRHPMVRHMGRTMLVRRLVLELVGKQIPADKRAVMSCENRLCINPDHIVMRSHREIMARQGALGKLSDPARVAKIAATKREKYAKLTMADARAIRASPETHEKTAAKYGIHPSKVASIRQHRCWRELHGNPFAGLGARS